MNRADLRALTPETLAALANRGLVKRAEKDLAAGAGPAVTATDDGTVRGVFPDGVETVIAPGADLDAADCSCGAPGVCRHRIGLVLAYRQTAEDTPQESGAFADWSPGEFDDDALAAAVGRPALAAARRVQDRGYSARLHRPTPEDPVPRVELPTCTVTFPVPHELGYALTDAAPAMRGEVVALAAWAFRAGDDAGRTELVTVGGRPQEGDPGESLRTALALAGDLLLDGVQQAGPVFAGSLRQCREELTAASRHWPAGAVADLQEQVEAYAMRGTRYDAGRYALLLAEIHARQRAAAVDPVQVLGTKEAPTTPLRRVRLVALGCRIGGSAQDRTAEVFFAHADAGIALVLRRRWDLAEGQDPTGYELSSRRLLGSALHALAAANVVSEHTSRAADRTIAISRGRIAATSVTPVGSAWTELPGTLLLRDVAAHMRGLGERPPQLIRPRVAAESVRVVAVESVGPIGYDPAGQQLEAVLHDPAGNEVLVRAEHNPLCPGGLDALAAALGGGQVQCVSGVLGSAGGRFVLDPLAVLTPAGVVVPDLAAGEGDTLAATAAARPADPIAAALEAGLAALADAAHHGLRRLTAPARTRLDDSATLLRRTGLRTAAGHLRDLEAALREDSGAVARWVDAHIHLAVSLETHRQAAA